MEHLAASRYRRDLRHGAILKFLPHASSKYISSARILFVTQPQAVRSHIVSLFATSQRAAG